MMKIDFSKRLKDLDGSESEASVTLGEVAVKSLVEMLKGDENETGENKFKRAALAKAIYGAGEVELSVQDIALIKDRIGKAFAPVVVFSAWNLIEG